MKNNNTEKKQKQKKAFYHLRGVTYFDKRIERTFFFILTIIMLACGIIAKLWVL
jgi:hypothetical protein